MKIRIKIKKAHFSSYWYADMIGQEMDVQDVSGSFYYAGDVSKYGSVGIGYVNVDDAEVVDSTKPDDLSNSISELFEKKVKELQSIGKEIIVRPLQEGDKVYYQKFSFKENGIIKTMWPDGTIFVVYHCGGDWDNYRNYTGLLTPLKYLKRGWYDSIHTGGGITEGGEHQ